MQEGSTVKNKKTERTLQRYVDRGGENTRMLISILRKNREKKGVWKI